MPVDCFSTLKLTVGTMPEIKIDDDKVILNSVPTTMQAFFGSIQRKYNYLTWKYYIMLSLYTEICPFVFKQITITNWF